MNVIKVPIYQQGIVVASVILEFPDGSAINAGGWPDSPCGCPACFVVVWNTPDGLLCECQDCHACWRAADTGIGHLPWLPWLS